MVWYVVVAVVFTAVGFGLAKLFTKAEAKLGAELTKVGTDLTAK